MDKVCIVLDQKSQTTLNQLQDKLLTRNVSYVFRLALSYLSEKILGQNSSIEILLPNGTKASPLPVIPKLPGMNEDVWESQMRRWHLTPEEYAAIVRQTIDNFAASGKPMNNPEAAIYGACKRYANEKHQQQTETAKDTTAAGSTRPSYVDFQDTLPM